MTDVSASTPRTSSSRRTTSSTAQHWRRRTGSPTSSRPTISSRGASGRATAASSGRGWAPPWSPPPPTYGTVNAPGYRYHAAVVAQAAATFRRLYPDRFWLSVGSGELLNEHVTGERWPPNAERNARLEECVDVIRRLWAGGTVTHRGRITVEEATLYTRPETDPPILGAALSTATTRWLAEWADGLIAVGPPDVGRV